LPSAKVCTAVPGAFETSRSLPLTVATVAPLPAASMASARAITMS
jgi:hypothetical protein